MFINKQFGKTFWKVETKHGNTGSRSGSRPTYCEFESQWFQYDDVVFLNKQVVKLEIFN
jgi:hypothetical protein